jgi:hypothetical protein
MRAREAPDADLADAAHRIRERALRQVMAMVNRLQPVLIKLQRGRRRQVTTPSATPNDRPDIAPVGKPSRRHPASAIAGQRTDALASHCRQSATTN